jgi:hypothetical protein
MNLTNSIPSDRVWRKLAAAINKSIEVRDQMSDRGAVGEELLIICFLSHIS